MTRQRTLPFGREQPLRLQLQPQPVECDAPEPAGARALEFADDELVLALLLVERQRAEHAHLHALVGMRGETIGLQPEHDGAQLRGAVPQREVAMPRRVPLPTRHLAPHPERRQ